MKRLLPDTVTGQLVALLVICVVAIHVVITLTIVLEHSFETGRPGGPGGRDLASLVRLVDMTPAPERAALLGRLQVVASRFALAATTLPATPPLPSDADAARMLGRSFPVWDEGDGYLVVRLSDGSAITAIPEAPPSPPKVGPIVATIVFLAIGIALFGSWGIAAITAPLRRFSAAVDSYDPDRPAEPLPERGPAELRRAVAAFNRMRERIARMVEDRTRVLTAVSHDLRTPITRIRLRAEFIEDPDMREPLLADLDHMASLVSDAVAHLRGAASNGARRAPTDLPSLLQTLADFFVDLGADVVYRGPDRLERSVAATEIRRAVQNLVENAVRHAGRVEIVLAEAPDATVVIAVEDDGPGIPAADRERLTAPFERGDSARTAKPGAGFGLGLSIARAVAEAHGGRLELADSEPQGLSARIVIPARP